MTRTTANINNVDIIVSALNKKSKRTLSNGRALTKQALHFSPGYRDFIYKIIANNSLKITSSYQSGEIQPEYQGDPERKLNKRQKSYILTDINNPSTLPHELGHAVDFWFGYNKALTRSVIIENDQTIYDISKEEFDNKYPDIYRYIMNEYKEIVTQKVDDKAFDIMMSNIDLYRELGHYPVHSNESHIKRHRREIHQKLEEEGFVEAYYQILIKDCAKPINEKYSPILDVLSSKYDLSDLFLDHHSFDYYYSNHYRPIQELFAGLFAAKVCSSYSYLDSVKTILPKTFNAFERLFVMFYDHIQNNKRFTDVKIKEAK